MQENMITYTMSNKGKIKITEYAFQRMEKYRQVNKEDFEAGGVLLGRFIVNTKDIVIDDVSIPLIGDKRTRTSFVRNAKSHQRIIDQQWTKSKGTCHYLGEWHTHPESYPDYSSVDIKNWKERLKNDYFTSRYLYFIILGIKKIEIWEGDRRTLKFKNLYKYEK
jgi:integrative and conjugative element protein (TIGR02256 family)